MVDAPRQDAEPADSGPAVWFQDHLDGHALTADQWRAVESWLDDPTNARQAVQWMHEAQVLRHSASSLAAQLRMGEGLDHPLDAAGVSLSKAPPMLGHDELTSNPRGGSEPAGNFRSPGPTRISTMTWRTRIWLTAMLVAIFGIQIGILHLTLHDEISSAMATPPHLPISGVGTAPDVPKNHMIAFTSTIYIRGTVDQVWQALTDPAQVSRYYMCPAMALGTAVGEPVAYGNKGKVLIEGRITDYQPNHLLGHTFHFADSADASTQVRYRLESDGPLIGVTLIHDGFTTEDQTFADISSGWPYILSNLKTWVETGVDRMGRK